MTENGLDVVAETLGLFEQLEVALFQATDRPEELLVVGLSDQEKVFLVEEVLV